MVVPGDDRLTLEQEAGAVGDCFGAYYSVGNSAQDYFATCAVGDLGDIGDHCLETRVVVGDWEGNAVEKHSTGNTADDYLRDKLEAEEEFLHA